MQEGSHHTPAEAIGQPHTLSALIGPQRLPLADFLPIALQLARALAQLHQLGLVHRDLSPAKISWHPASRRATLRDFGVASAAGDLAYISPEQTGRTGRAVDSRSDLYSLGAIFYALLSGAPPFASRDPIELVHAHLARLPLPPTALAPDVPPVLSELILKLLEKEPELRYPSAEALLADLEEINEQWLRSGAVRPFDLARRAVPRQLSLNETLYGRAQESAALLAAFHRAADGRRELVLVSGAAGIGKTALVCSLERPVAERRGYFIAGKFDQLQRSLPYAGLVHAFRSLVRKLLTEPDSALAAWRQRIQEAVAPNGQILVNVIPEIEAILGPQAPVAELEAVESKNRFSQIFTAFLSVFARPEHPFVLFLDDLQWADAASLQLIKQWLAGDQRGHLLIIGAYRDSDEGRAHAQTLTAELRGAGAAAPAMHLQPLPAADVAALVADALEQDAGRCAALAVLLAKKTAGNPFFIRRLLRMLHDDGLIRYDAAVRSWRWDIDEIQRAPVSDNVLDLMVHTIDRLPPATRELLQAGACIGHRFDIDTLASLSGRARTVVMNQLWPALDDGLLLPLREAIPARAAAGDAAPAGPPVTLRFVHDRVQQAAYSLLTPDALQALHLAIGRLRLRQSAHGQPDEQLFDIADQLNLGAALIATAEERLQLAQLNLAAGRRAKGTAAYQAGFLYLMHGRQQLPAHAWRTQPELSYAIHRELAECAYLTGQHATAELFLDEALQHAPSRIAKADLYSLRVLAATVASDWAGALRWGREGLAVFGHAWPLDGLAEANEAEAAAVMRNLGARPIMSLVDQAEVQDEETRACMRLLSLLGPPAYFSGSAVLTFLVTRSTNLSLLHGPSGYSAYAYVFYGALHNAYTGQYQVGHAFGLLALALARRFGNRAEESRALEVFGLVVHAWRAPLRDSLPIMQEGHRAGVESGELAYAAFNLCGLLINGLPAGVALPELLNDAGIAIDFARRYQNRTAIEISLPFRQLARALTGLTRDPLSFDDDDFEQARFVVEAQGNHTAMGQFWVARLQAAYLLGDIDGARRSAGEGAQFIQAGILGMITSAEHSFYSALTLLADGTVHDAGQQAALAAQLQQLHTWAGHCPENFLHKHQIVAAELARIEGSPWQAMELFGAAIDQATRHGFVQDAALANELAARLFLEHQQLRVAGVYLNAALDGYRQWGASAKVRALRQAYRDRLPMPASADDDTAAPPLAAVHAHDALGLIKAAQAIAAETEPEALFRRILQIVVEVAGAQRGILVLGDSQAFRVRARVAVDAAATIVLEDTPLADCAALPAPIARYVARLKQPLVLGDAAVDGPFAGDASVRGLGLRSVLCVPLKRHEQVIGLLYLENNALARAFTAERVDVVQALAAQAAISLENSTWLMERRRAEEAARFLAGAGAALAESLDYQETLARVVALAVPAFADWCFLDLVGADDTGDGGVERAQVAFADPNQAALAAALKRYSISAGDQRRYPLTQAPHQGGALLLPDIPGQQLRSLAHDDAHFALVRQLGARSLISVPLVARERTLGVLTFIVAQSGRRYDADDLAVARKLADRCALGMDNASLYQEARAAIQVRDDFLAVASHELRTPLTPLLVQLQLMERRLPKLFENPDSAAWLAKGLATLQRQGKRLERLVNELLDITRITGGQLQLQPTPVNLEEVVLEVLERLRESGEMNATGSPLALRCATPVTGLWDGLRVEQIVTNLLSNAFKYGEGQPIAVDIAVQGDSAVLRVTDRGPGIEPAHVQRIFGRFERAVSARNFGGLGLGLYIASEIAGLMGGAIQVDSVLGEGSTFTVTLPLGGAL